MPAIFQRKKQARQSRGSGGCSKLELFLRSPLASGLFQLQLVVSAGTKCFWHFLASSLPSKRLLSLGLGSKVHVLQQMSDSFVNIIGVWCHSWRDG